MRKNIADIYGEYRIPPWLALHMYRVAAVAATVFDARRRVHGAESDTGRDDLISACLLHDMGNIIKFDFTILDAEVTKEGKDHWEIVRSDMIARYGRDEHHATLAILDELGVSPRVREIVDGIGFSKNEATLRSGDTLLQIAVYADSRVVPSGVNSLDERIRDMYVRYADRYPERAIETERQVKAIHDIEQELFRDIPLTPADITETSIAAIREELPRFDITASVG